MPLQRYDPPTLAFAVLLIAATVNRYTLEVGGLSVKAEHLAILLLGGLFWRQVAAALPGAWRALGWSWAWVATLLTAGLLNAPQQEAALRGAALVGLVVAGGLVTYALADTPARLLAAVRLLVGVAVVEGALAYTGLVAAWFYIPFGTQPGRGGIAVPYGTLWEPNVLGSYLAAAATLLLALLPVLSGRRRVGAAAALAFLLGALGLSLARGAWVGGAAGAGVVLAGYWLLPALRADLRRAMPLLAAAVGAALFFLLVPAPLLFPGTSAGIAQRTNLPGYTPANDPSLRARLDSFSTAWPDIVAHPLLGNGAGSYAARHKDERNAPGWLANLELHLLYDSGLLGLGLFLGGLVVVAWRAAQAVRHYAVAHRQKAAAALGLLGAAAALLIAYQATEATWLAYSWLYIGLLARAGETG